MSPSSRTFASLLACLLLASPAAHADVATVPVGAITLTAPGPATEGGTPVGTVISIPLEPAPAWRSVSTGVAGSTLTDSTATWTAGGFATAAAPYFLEVLSGSQAGRAFLVTANTANSITVQVRTGETLQALIGTDPVEFQLLPGHTLATIFGADGAGLRKTTSANTADNVLLWSGTAWETYFHNGTSWRRVGSLSSQNNAVLYPDESIFVLRREPAPYELVITGFAPALGKRTEIASSGLTLTANRLPTPTTFAELALQTSPGWITNASANSADNVLVWSGTAWQTYFHNGTSWRRVGSLSNQNTTTIPAGAGIFVLRRGTPGSNTVVLQNLNYSLSL